MRYASLESLRAVAAIMVVLFHMPFIASERHILIQNSALFVDFFFVLSGFVMTYAYRDKLADGLRAADYLILRIGRLFPLHLFVMMAWMAAFSLFTLWGENIPAFDARHTSESFQINLFLINSFGLQSFLSWNYPAWSIGAELIAYVLFFIVLRLFGRQFGLGHALAVSLVAYAFLVRDNPTTMLRTFDMGAIRCIGGFFLGVAVYLFKEKYVDPSWRPGTLLEGATIALVAATITVAPGSAVTELNVILAFGLLVLTFSTSQGYFSRLLNRPLPVYLGKISYSIYMVHALVISLVAQVVSGLPDVTNLALAEASSIPRVFLYTGFAPLLTTGVLLMVLAISVFTHRYVEEPFRRLSRKIAPHRSENRVRSTALPENA